MYSVPKNLDSAGSCNYVYAKKGQNQINNSQGAFGDYLKVIQTGFSEGLAPANSEKQELDAICEGLLIPFAAAEGQLALITPILTEAPKTEYVTSATEGGNTNNSCQRLPLQHTVMGLKGLLSETDLKSTQATNNGLPADTKAYDAALLPSVQKLYEKKPEALAADLSGNTEGILSSEEGQGVRSDGSGINLLDGINNRGKTPPLMIQEKMTAQNAMGTAQRGFEVKENTAGDTLPWQQSTDGVSPEKPQYSVINKTAPQQPETQNNKKDGTGQPYSNITDGTKATPAVYSGRESEITEAVHRNDLINRISRHATDADKQASRSIVMELLPKELGKIKVKMEYLGGKLEMKITADTDAAVSVLREGIGQLKASLTENRVDVGSIDIGNKNPGFQFSDTAGGFRQYGEFEKRPYWSNSHFNSEQNEENKAEITYYRPNQLLNYLI